MTIPAYIERYIDRRPDGCWIWTGGCTEHGYGVCRSPFTEKSANAHRVIYRILIGDPGTGIHLHHTCEVPACVNPAHLEPKTPHDHMHGHVNSVARINSAKTHCAGGHSYAVHGYTREGKHGAQRECRLCTASTWPGGGRALRRQQHEPDLDWRCSHDAHRRDLAHRDHVAAGDSPMTLSGLIGFLFILLVSAVIALAVIVLAVILVGGFQ